MYEDGDDDDDVAAADDEDSDDGDWVSFYTGHVVGAALHLVTSGRAVLAPTQVMMLITHSIEAQAETPKP